MNRPGWCPYQSCQFLVRTQEAACVGKLPEPQNHAGILNTHRLCMRNQVESEAPVAWEINRADAWNLGRILKAALADEKETTT